MTTKTINHENLFAMSANDIVAEFSVADIQSLTAHDAEDLKEAIEMRTEEAREASGRLYKKLSRLHESVKRQMKKATRQNRQGRQNRHADVELA